MSITAKELAKKLSISAAAVSMALNNKPGVSTDTRNLVMDAALKYGYDFSKISNKHTISGSIYFVIYKNHGTIVTDTPFFSQVSEGVSLECKNRDCKLKISYVYEDEDEETISKQIEDIQFSDCIGIILLGTEMAADDLRLFLNMPIPIVLLDAYFETVACNSVIINNVQGAYQAASYLIRKRGTQPGYLKSSYFISNFGERSSGFYKAVRSFGMASQGSIVHELSPSMEGAYADMLEIIKRGDKLADCYFADNDLIAAGALKALKENGYKVPKDIAIVGFDNLPISSMIEPTITTIHVPKEYIGKAAVERLLLLLKDSSLPPVKTEVLTTLIKRKSV
ncbi:MAG: LacI family DNA-binding transcriptional regulator [Suipraeoptans sp.]